MSATESPLPPIDPPPDGWLDAKMRAVFGRSWRTGMASRALWLLTAANVVIVAVGPDVVPARVIAALGALVTFVSAAGMSAAKDDKVTGLPPPAPPK